MTTTRKVSADEKGVCARVARIRGFLGLSQQDFAEEMGLTRDQLANIETGRTILSVQAGWSICSKANFNQLFLANGDPPFSPYIPVSPGIVEFRGSPSFRSVCISGPIADELRGAMASQPSSDTPKSVPKEILIENEQIFLRFIRQCVQRTPLNLWHALLRHLIAAWDGFATSHTLGQRVWEAAGYTTLPEFRHEADISSKKSVLNSLDKASEFGNSIATMMTLKSLLEAVRRRTAKPGMKAKLAAALGVSQSRISDWLKGTCKPDGENVLRLLEWVNQPGEEKS